MKIMIHDQMLHQFTISAGILTTQIFPWLKIFTKNLIVLWVFFSIMST